MNTVKITTFLSTAMLVLTTGAAAATAVPANAGTGRAGAPTRAAETSRHSTPNECIRLNHGDYNPCNVGNSGAGNLPYRHTAPRTPNECIRLNHGDYNPCNVGNSGAGNLPYRVVQH